MKKVRYIGHGFYTLITHNKIYEVINDKDNCILIINDFGDELWYIADEVGLPQKLFEEIPLEYIRNETITEILS